MKRLGWVSMLVGIVSTVCFGGLPIQGTQARINPRESRLQYVIGQSHMLEGSDLTSKKKDDAAFWEYDAAADSFKKAIELDPSHVEAYLALADDYMNHLFHSDLAIVVLKKLRAIQPADDSVIVLIGIANYNVGRYDDSLSTFTEATRPTTAPESASVAHYWIGKILSDRKSYSEAIPHYREAVRLKPNYADAFNDMGTAYYRLKQYPPSIAAYKEAIRFKPDAASLYGALYLAYRDSGDLTVAAATLAKIKTMDPKLYEELAKVRAK